MARALKIILVSILISLLIAAFLRHSLCRLLNEKATTRALGLQLFIEDVNLDVLSNSLYIRGITLFNPPGFENEVLGRAKEIFIQYEPLSFLKGRVHLRRVKADISEINIIRRGLKSSNIPTFKRDARSGEASKQARLTPKKPERSISKKEPKLLIDSLELSLEKAVFIDYEAEIGEPALIVFTLKTPYFFKNISELNYVVDSVSTEEGFRTLLNTKTAE